MILSLCWLIILHQLLNVVVIIKEKATDTGAGKLVRIVKVLQGAPGDPKHIPNLIGFEPLFLHGLRIL